MTARAVTRAPHLSRRLLVAVGMLAAATLAATTSGLVQIPDLEHALTELSEQLGSLHGS
jgi:hypothetical protein